MNLDSYLTLLKNTANTINDILGSKVNGFNECLYQGPLSCYTYMNPSDPKFRTKIYINLSFTKIYTGFGHLNLCTSMMSIGPKFNRIEEQLLIKKLNLKYDSTTFNKYNYSTNKYEKDTVLVMDIADFNEWHTSDVVRDTWKKII